MNRVMTMAIFVVNIPLVIKPETCRGKTAGQCHDVDRTIQFWKPSSQTRQCSDEYGTIRFNLQISYSLIHIGCE